MNHKIKVIVYINGEYVGKLIMDAYNQPFDYSLLHRDVVVVRA